ncbi:hypothetical protein A9179_03430 [Pseudomonas alcaligenes]|uniref:Solute-binding protein family 3/N-terminal domain-containing protein n=1 Tax=Aquipseudomonas alcaligenes TaxID=43263 RepID=A0ABR7RWY4_AQUAC|nr:hypothetical protein [Pseudomonas alcaligenes]MBC9249324.1 hypothetical protein [Pseudomonas alcaligenes]
MSPRLRALLVLLMLCAAPPTWAGQAPSNEITWHMSPWPGLINIRNGQPDNGIIVDLLQQITQRLPDYQHRYSMANLTRGLEQLKRESLSCFLPAFPTPERAEHGYYVGLFATMPHQLVVRTTDVERIRAGQAEISLQQLLHERNLRGGLVLDRSYGPVLDPLLQAADVQAQLLRIQTSSAGSNLYGMLEHGRIDYLLDYAEVVQYVQRQQDFARDLSLLPLQETSTPYVSGIYCSKTAEGAELIRRIDTIARQPEVISHFIAAQKAYVPPATLHHYQAWIDRFFAQRAQQDLTTLPH